MDTETVVAYLIIFCPIAMLIGVSIWLAWKDKDRFD